MRDQHATAMPFITSITLQSQIRNSLAVDLAVDQLFRMQQARPASLAAVFKRSGLLNAEDTAFARCFLACRRRAADAHLRFVTGVRCTDSRTAVAGATGVD